MCAVDSLHTPSQVPQNCVDLNPGPAIRMRISGLGLILRITQRGPPESSLSSIMRYGLCHSAFPGIIHVNVLSASTALVSCV